MRKRIRPQRWTAGLVLVLVFGFGALPSEGQWETDLDRAEKLYEENRFEECVEACNRAIARNPKSIEALRLRGSAYWRLKKYDPALSDFDQAVALFPFHSRVLIGRARVYLDLERFQEALRDADAALKIDREYVEAFITRALARKELKDFEGSLADLDRALSLAPENSSALMNRSSVMQMLGGDRSSAADAVQTAVSDPGAGKSAVDSDFDERRERGSTPARGDPDKWRPPAPMIASGQAELTDVEASARKVREALLARDLDALLELAHPNRREALWAVLASSVEDMPKLGGWLAKGKLKRTGETLAEYEIVLEEARFYVQFVLLDGEWRLWAL